MLRVAVSQSEGIYTERVIADVLAQCAEQLGGVAPEAGILLASGHFDYRVALAAIHERFPGIELVGSTMQGSICSPSGFAEDALSLLLLASDDITISTGLGRDCMEHPQAAVDEALAAARRKHTRPATLCLAFPHISGGDAYDLLHRLSEALGPGCDIFGAAPMSPPMSRLDMHHATQFFGREVVYGALPIVLLSGPLVYSFSVENSWTPVGARQRVTRAHGHTVERIGERSALDMYRYYLGEHTRPAREFPLAVFDDHDEHYCLRIPLSYDRDTGAILYSGPVPEGATVQITEAVREHMLASTERSLARTRAQLGDLQPALALEFSCAARKWVLGTETRREAELTHAHAPGTPVFGVYGGSEIAPHGPGQESRLHQATLVSLFLAHAGQSGAHPDREWTPPARVNENATRRELRTSELLERRLQRSEAMRADLEHTRELNNRLLRTITREVEDSRAMIAHKNQELERLYAELAAEKHKSDKLLLEILPREVADELKRRGQVDPVLYESVTVMFADFKDFTRHAAAFSPRALLRELDYFFSEFDAICERHGLEKLKTIGDAYMLAGGIPAENESHARDVVAAAWDMQTLMTQAADEHRAPGGQPWQLRIGVNTGPLVAGVIGQRKFAYDIWGDTVNIAARMESAGEPGRINIARTTSEAVRDHFICEPRGRIPVKNAGEIEMYFVVDRRAP